MVKYPERWTQRKFPIEVKAFTVLPVSFLEASIPPEVAWDEPACRDTL